MPRPECIRCGATSKLFELEPNTYACKWQGGCDHRAMQQEARIARLEAQMNAQALPWESKLIDGGDIHMDFEEYVQRFGSPHPPSFEEFLRLFGL